MEVFLLKEQFLQPCQIRGKKCEDWDSVKVAQRVAEGNSNQTESMVWAVHERDMSYLIFVMLLCQRVQVSLGFFYACN